MKATYLPTPGISIGSPSTVPPAWRTFCIDAWMSSTEITTEGCCPGMSALRWKKPPLIAPGVVGPRSPVAVVVAST